MKNSESKKSAMLKQIAADELEQIMKRLPADIRRKLKHVAIVLEDKPEKRHLAEGIEQDTLGLFVGPSIQDGDTIATLPPQIFLFLSNIKDQAQDSGGDYREEFRRTLLHEIGHYLGLDEDDLKLRDID